MTETTDTDALLRAARSHIIASLNAGLSVQAAIRAAIDDGIDEAAAHAAGRALKLEMVQLKKNRALRSIVMGAVVALAAVALVYSPLARIVHINFTILFIAFVAGLVYVVISFLQYATVESRVR